MSLAADLRRSSQSSTRPATNIFMATTTGNADTASKMAHTGPAHGDAHGDSGKREPGPNEPIAGGGAAAAAAFDENGPGGPAADNTPASKLRRSSVDGSGQKSFLIRDIDATLSRLLQSEDTDHNHQITVDDSGPKVLYVGTANSGGYRTAPVRGTYMLSNLLQELTVAQTAGRKSMFLDEARLSENPVARLRRLIATVFWPNLTRQVTRSNVRQMAYDNKIVEEVSENGTVYESKESYRVYVPHERHDQYDFYASIAAESPELGLDVQYLPETIDADYILSINKKPGILALACTPDPRDPSNLVSQPYVVPGGRFNEFYGWDSYMIAMGLLADVTPENSNTENLRLCRAMTENFIYEIRYYNKILNANRSYFLGRSQPPFLTDMAVQTYNKWVQVEPGSEEALDFLKRAILAAVKEYTSVWCVAPRLDPETGLSCYHPEGKGVPPETEASHFDSVLKPYVEKHRVSQKDFIDKYNSGEIQEPALDEYFLHDRAVRESGHDTSYRLEGKAAYLATVDLNALLYKYEVDIAGVLEKFGDLQDPVTGKVETASVWHERSQARRKNISKYLWNEENGVFVDYHVRDKKQEDYVSATAFWPLWAGAATQHQADAMVSRTLPKLEEFGGLAGGTLESRGEVGLDRPSRQWDYPFGWAPHQILAWEGLEKYGHGGVTRRLAYRWLFMMTRAFVDYNGVVVEKYNVLKDAAPHKVDAEYGNQGVDFKGVALEGFGWVNASFMIGLGYLNEQARRSLGALVPPDVFLANLNESQKGIWK